jgi:hypothetical protein
MEIDPKEVQQLYASAEKSLVNYRHLLLHSDPKMEVEPAEYHHKWSDDLLHGTANEAKEGYRASGKSQYVLRAFPPYCLTFPSKKRNYIVILKNNATLAQNKLKEIEAEYLSNGLISANKVKIREQSGSVFSVDVRDKHGEVMNVRIEAYGKGSSIRGLSYLDSRPKIIICDDLQDREEMRGETVPENDWRWFMSDLYFLGDSAEGNTSRIFLIGNNLGEKCIIERIFASKGDLDFKCDRTPAMIEVNGKEVSTWPSKYTVEDIHTQREKFRNQGLLSIWLEEKMCLAVDEETKIFKKEHRKYYVPATAMQIRNVCNVDATLDPASSPNPGACFRAITVKGIDKNNNWFILDIRYGRWDSVEVIDQMFDVVKTWNPSGFGIEKGMYKQIIEPFIFKEMSKRNQFFNIIPIEHAKQGSKYKRVCMLSPRYAAGTIWHPEHAPWLAELENELDGVTKDGFKSLFVDVIDALAMQEQIGTAPIGNIDHRETSIAPMPDNTGELVMGATPRGREQVEMTTII